VNGEGEKTSGGRSAWPFVYLAVVAIASILTWTVVRPHLVITDGVPTATDPFTPFGVFMVNVVLAAAACAAVGLVHLLWAIARKLF